MKKYEAQKIAKCPRCHSLTEQRLFDYVFKLYKCLKCNNIHS